VRLLNPDEVAELVVDVQKLPTPKGEPLKE
jgi:hypothetical protein